MPVDEFQFDLLTRQYLDYLPSSEFLVSLTVLSCKWSMELELNYWIAVYAYITVWWTSMLQWFLHLKNGRSEELDQMKVIYPALNQCYTRVARSLFWSGLFEDEASRIGLSNTDASVTSDSLCSSKSSTRSGLSVRGFKFRINDLNWSVSPVSCVPRRDEFKSPNAETRLPDFGLTPSFFLSDSLRAGEGDKGSSRSFLDLE